MSLHAPDLRPSCVLPATRYIFALLCLLNVNMGALDLSRMPGAAEGRSGGGGMDDDLDDTDGLEAFQVMSPKFKRRPPPPPPPPHPLPDF